MRLLYQCEACGTVHKEKAAAEWVETQIPAKPELTRVTVKTRYDGEKQADVIEWVLRSRFCDSVWAAQEFERLQGLIKAGSRGWPPHEWCARLGNTYQLGKEWWSDVVPPDSIKEFDQPEWRTIQMKTCSA